MLVFVGKNKMLTYVYIFNLIKKSRAFIVIIGLFGHPKRKILGLSFQGLLVKSRKHALLIIGYCGAWF